MYYDMLICEDNTTLQAEIKVKLNYKLGEDDKVCCVAPGSLVLVTNEEISKENYFAFPIAWEIYEAEYEISDDEYILISFALRSLNNSIVTENLSSSGLGDLVQGERYDLSLFNNIIDAYMDCVYIDINNKERKINDSMETISVKIYDPINNSFRKFR